MKDQGSVVELLSLLLPSPGPAETPVAVIAFLILLSVGTLKNLLLLHDYTKRKKINLIKEAMDCCDSDSCARKVLEKELEKEGFHMATGVRLGPSAISTMWKILEKEPGVSVSDFKRARVHLREDRDGLFVKITKFDTVFYFVTSALGWLFLVGGILLMPVSSILLRGGAFERIHLVFMVFLTGSMLLAQSIPYRSARKIKDALEHDKTKKNNPRAGDLMNMTRFVKNMIEKVRKER